MIALLGKGIGKPNVVEAYVHNHVKPPGRAE